MNKWIELIAIDDYLGIKKYMKEGADLNSSTELGESVLYCAVRDRCDMQTLELLINEGADIYDFDNEGVSILDVAIAQNHKEMVEYMLEKNIDVNKTSRKSGFTLLMAAACYGRLDFAKLLLKKGANKNIKDVKGFTAIDFARKMNKKSILKLLEFDETQEQNRAYAR